MTAAEAFASEQRRPLALVEDSQDRFTLGAARYLAWGTGLLAFIAVGVWLLFQAYTQLLMLAGGLLLVAASAGTYPILHHRGRGTLSAMILLTVILLLCACFPLLVPEVTPAVPIANLLVIVLSYQVLGRRAHALGVAAVISLITSYALQIVWAPRLFPPLGSTGSLVTATFSVASLLLAGVIIYRVILGQKDSYAEVQQARREIEWRAEAEAEQRKLLESTVKEYVNYMARVSQGDLTARLTLDERVRDDPLVLLGLNLNATVGSLQQMTAQIRDAAANLNSSSAEILTATAQQAAGASEQSASVTQASATITEVRSSAEQTAQIAQGVSQLAQRTAEVAQAGQQALAGTITGMQEVKLKVEAIAQNVLSLSEQAQAIGQIIATVTDIASQSNMLALNAAVEAARAGDAGRGFAVVAGEVRALAEQSRAATVQVKEILSRIQGGVNAAVMATEQGMKKADAGMRLVSEAGTAIEKLRTSVGESTQAAEQIAAAAGQQLAGVTQISQAMQSIDQATVQNVAGARQVEQAAASLDSLAGRMRTLVERYRL